MSWQECTLMNEEAEEEQKIEIFGNMTQSTLDQDDLNTIKQIQLQNYTDPDKDLKRQEILYILQLFSERLSNNGTEDNIQSLLTENCRVFWFDMKEKPLISHYQQREGISDILQRRKLLYRHIRETNIDTLKNTACQLSSCRVLYEESDIPVDEISAEIFTISDHKIIKYILITVFYTASPGFEDPFEPSIKDKLRAKVKAMNFALTGEPDFERLASFFHESIDYKIWAWDTQKRFIFQKHNFAASIMTLEQNMKITCVIPLNIHTDEPSRVSVGIYAYFLEDRKSREKFVWITHVLYMMNQDYEITHVSQSGELHQEGQIPVLYEASTRERIIKQINDVYLNFKSSLDFWYEGSADYSCRILRLGLSSFPFMGYMKNFDSIRENLLQRVETKKRFKWLKPVDIFVDHQDPCSDVSFQLTYSKIEVDGNNTGLNDQFVDLFTFTKICFEENKIVRAISFESYMPEPIPLPFDDDNLTFENIMHK